MGASAAGYAAALALGVSAYEVAATPKPKAPKPVPMPNQTDTLQAQQLQEAKDAAARYGRAATILTNNDTNGDKLGP